MGIKTRLKYKKLTLFELIISVFILSIILTQGLFLLSSQIKQSAKISRSNERFLETQELLLTLEGLFFHLNIQDRSCLKSGEKIFIHFDYGYQMEPKRAGFQKSFLYLEDKNLVLEHQDGIFKKILCKEVSHFSVKFYNQKGGWQDIWSSDSQGLPEMIHLLVKTKHASIDHKFLCPYNQTPIVLCRFCHLSFL